MKNIIRMSIISTVGMTLYSYIISAREKEKFFEPLILNQLIFPVEKKKKAHNISGYLLHYLLGLFFSMFYKPLYHHCKLKPNILSDSLLGMMNGFVGVFIWHLTFRFHPKPPKVKLKRYYRHLIAGHIIFGILNGFAFNKNNS